MKYINKDFNDPIVTRHNQELKNSKLDATSLSNPTIHSGLGGNDLYEYVRKTQYVPHFGDVKDLLNKEQGGICCYCGSKLFYPTRFSVEHVFPKSKDRTLVGEYGNLLLSCHSTEEERKEIKTTCRKRKDRHKHYHCDEAKGELVLNYTPLQSDIASHFEYNIDGTVKGLDALADDDIRTLGLQCDELVKRRKAAIDAVLFDENNQMLDSQTLTSYVNSIMNMRNDEYNEFCFVLHSVLKKLGY